MNQLRDFKNHIEFLTSLFKEYGEVLERKEKYIIKGKYDELTELIYEEESMVVRIDEAERERERLSKALCRMINIPENSSISQIAEAMGEEEGTQLMILIARLMECLQEISMLHFNIDRMIGFQLKNIQLLQDTATGQDRINTYDMKGKYHGDNQKKLFKGQG
ncbi:MAG: flagellar export chaperone FlgN [Thermotogota bacterium]